MEVLFIFALGFLRGLTVSFTDNLDDFQKLFRTSRDKVFWVGLLVRFKEKVSAKGGVDGTKYNLGGGITGDAVGTGVEGMLDIGERRDPISGLEVVEDAADGLNDGSVGSFNGAMG